CTRLAGLILVVRRRDRRRTDRARQDIVAAEQQLVVTLACLVRREVDLDRLFGGRSARPRSGGWRRLARGEGEDLAGSRLSDRFGFYARGDHRHPDLAAEIVVERRTPDDVRIGVD